MPNTIRAAVLAPGQLRHLLRVTEATSRHPERDQRTFSTRLYAQTGDIDVVRLLLGHNSIDCSMRYIECDPRILRQAFIDVL